MRNHQQTPDSVRSAFAAVSLLAVVLVAIAHPLGIGFGLLAVGAVALLVRTVWRQATTRGFTLPGIGGTLRIETTAGRDEQSQWAMTVSISEH